MKYLLTGGGTGGHVYPALAIADEIRRTREDAEFLYVGRRDKLESWVVPGQGYPIRFVRSRPFPRVFSPFAMLRFMLTLWVGTMQGALILLRFRPQVIIGTGGYVSAPILFAYGMLAKIGLCRARVFLYEPNAYPGLLNQVVGRLAQRIGVAFEQAGRWFDMKRVAVVGYPVRRSFLHLDREEARRNLGIEPHRKVVLAYGGSGGAQVINEAVVQALPLLRANEDILLMHITGRYKGPDYDAVAETGEALAKIGIDGDTPYYRRFDYMDQIDQATAAADLVICRGGAGTLTEMGVSGTPALIVPLPSSAEDHQAINAREMERMGAAQVLYQEATWKDARVCDYLDGEKVARLVLAMCADAERLGAMSQAAKAIPVRNSLEKILAELDSLVAGQRPPPLNLEFPQYSGGLPADPNALLRWVEARVNEAGGVDGLERCELAYLRYQADCLLVSEGWCEIPLGHRNVGIKLVGVLHYWERLPLLLSLVEDRTPLGWVARFCGGDFRHGGILRRNAIERAILKGGESGAHREDFCQVQVPIRKTLLLALSEDPYFEVRAVAARALGELFKPEADLFAADGEIEHQLVIALDDRSPDVVIAALKALGGLGTGKALLERLRRFYLHPNWQFRQGVVEALVEFLRRGVVQPAELEHDLDQVLASTPHFKPEFTLNERLRELADRVHTGSSEGNAFANSRR
jgi:UDP-N-acetylglucosamine--N-acetylmuramyl-(pentapeptide) pyrophosphoryl-undecaprenol N-acetylglucosamine transferase